MNATGIIGFSNHNARATVLLVGAAAPLRTGGFMPFVEIFVAEPRPLAERRQLADAVHRALVRTIDVPPDDRFQSIHVHPSADLIYDPSYLGIARSDGFVAIR